jgi:hypothetical protein
MSGDVKAVCRIALALPVAFGLTREMVQTGAALLHRYCSVDRSEAVVACAMAGIVAFVIMSLWVLVDRVLIRVLVLLAAGWTLCLGPCRWIL